MAGIEQQTGLPGVPGIQSEMKKQPVSISDRYVGSGKLRGKVRHAQCLRARGLAR
jgi:hypothetical protein